MDVWVAEERVCLACSQAVHGDVNEQHKGLRKDILVIKTDLREDKISQTFLVFALELLNKVIDKMVVEIFSTNCKMGITSSGLYSENTLLNSKERYIKSSFAKIEDEDVMFASNLLVETSVGDHSSCRLIDDSENVHSQDGSGYNLFSQIFPEYCWPRPVFNIFGPNYFGPVFWVFKISRTSLVLGPSEKGTRTRTIPDL